MKNIVIGMLAHVDAGKTTLSEGLLYTGNVIRKLGRVDNKDAFLDTDKLERLRGITIFAKQAVIKTENTYFTLLDTPGHVDFSAEMERTLAVLDYAVLVISAADGVQSRNGCGNSHICDTTSKCKRKDTKHHRCYGYAFALLWLHIILWICRTSAHIHVLVSIILSVWISRLSVALTILTISLSVLSTWLAIILSILAAWLTIILIILSTWLTIILSILAV